MPEWMAAALRHPGIDCWNHIQFTNFTQPMTSEGGTSNS